MDEETLSFSQLRKNSCRFVLNDGKPSSFLFCSAPMKAGSSYCEEHHKICYTKLEKTGNKFRLHNKLTVTVR
jgi:hypothetical protein